MSDVVEDDVDERLLKLETHVAHIRADVGDLKSEIRDLRGEFKELRTELKGEMKELRAELKGEMQELRAELKGEMQELGGDVSSIKDQMATIRVDMVMTRVWALCQSAAILGVMARGFHWI
jgi:chromosome segregation ATPase